MYLDKTVPIPLYYQLAENLRQQVEAGSLKPGDQIPSERELSEQLGISRMTVRQAINYLTQKGTLVIRPGIGTFVAEAKLTYDALHLFGFSQEMMSQGRIISSRVLEQEVVTPPPALAQKLGLDHEAKMVKVVRLRLEGNTPLVLDTVHIPAALCPGLELEDLAHHSLYAILEAKYGIVLQCAEEMFEATVANEYESRILEIPRHSPLILLEGVTSSTSRIQVEHFKGVYRADRFKFRLESQRNAWINEVALPPRLSLVFASER